MLQPGAIVADSYEILERLGRGAFGFVWRAKDITIDRLVAIKELMDPTEEHLAGFLREMIGVFSRSNHCRPFKIFTL